MPGQVSFCWDNQNTSLVCPWATIWRSLASSPGKATCADTGTIKNTVQFIMYEHIAVQNFEK